MPRIALVSVWYWSGMTLVSPWYLSGISIGCKLLTHMDLAETPSPPPPFLGAEAWVGIDVVFRIYRVILLYIMI